MDIKTVVADFANQLSSLIEEEAVNRARAAVLAAFEAPVRRGPGRPPKSAAPAAFAAPAVMKKARKKAPLQLCPVPGCKNPAAPVFGMVCAKHKDLPKAKIKKFREARRAKKLGTSTPKARKRRVAKKVVARKKAVSAKKPPAAKKAPPRKKAPKRRTKPAAVAASPTPAAPAPAAA